MQSERADSTSKPPKDARRYRRLFAIAVMALLVFGAITIFSGGDGLRFGQRQALAQSCSPFWTYYSYDAAGRLSQVQDACNYTITYSYDAVGNLLSVNP